MNCDLRDAYLDGTLTHAEAHRFGVHAAQCAECSEAIATWRRASHAIRGWAGPRPADPSSEQVEQLLLRARSSDRAPHGRRWRSVAWVGAAALAAAVALWALWGERPVDSVTDRVPIAAGTSERPAAIPIEVWAPVGAPEVVRRGADTFLVADGAKLAATEQHLRLDRGVAAFDIASRMADETFAVDVGEHEVRVIGTRFSITAHPGQPVAVHVVEGRVEVVGPGGPWVLEAGQAVHAEPGQSPREAADPQGALHRLGEVMRPPTAPTPEVPADVPEATTPPALQAAREALLDDPATAVALARQRLAVDPDDVDTRQVLAQALERSGDRPGAVAAWLAVADAAQDDTAWAAQRSGARLLQQLGSHGEAAEVYEAMLLTDRGGPLRAEAHLQLGRSLHALGRVQEARAQWSHVVREYGGTRPAMAAQELLAPR